MTSPGPRGLSRAILARLGELVRGCFAQGTVTAFTTAAPFTVTVTVPGSAAPLVVPRLKSYSPAVGEVVWLFGPPGSWVAVGALA